MPDSSRSAHGDQHCGEHQDDERLHDPVPPEHRDADDRDREDRDPEVATHLLLDPAVEPRGSERRAVARPAEQVREPEQKQVMRRDRLIERGGHRQRRSHARATEDEQREQLDGPDAQTERERAGDATGGGPIATASQHERERVRRTADHRHPQELRLADEGNERERYGDERGARPGPALAHEVDAEEHEREPRHGREVRNVHEMKHREPAERVRDARHDRAGSGSPQPPRPRERTGRRDPDVPEHPPPVRRRGGEPPEHCVERIEHGVLTRADHRVAAEDVLCPPGPVSGPDGPPHRDVRRDMEVVHVAVHCGAASGEHLPVRRGDDHERDRESKRRLSRSLHPTADGGDARADHGDGEV